MPHDLCLCDTYKWATQLSFSDPQRPDHWGECHRHSPITLCEASLAWPASHWACWPVIRADAFCGDHEPKT